MRASERASAGFSGSWLELRSLDNLLSHSPPGSPNAPPSIMTPHANPHTVLHALEASVKQCHVTLPCFLPSTFSFPVMENCKKKQQRRKEGASACLSGTDAALVKLYG